MNHDLPNVGKPPMGDTAAFFWDGFPKLIFIMSDNVMLWVGPTCWDCTTTRSILDTFSDGR